MKETMIMLVLIVSLMGCSKVTRNTNGIDENYRTGTNGILTKFIDNMPMDKMFESTDFIISFEVSNEGATDIQNGIFSFSLEPDYVDTNEWRGDILISNNPDVRKAQFNLLGKTIDSPGQKSIVSVRAKTKALDSQTETHTTTIFLTTCYPYKTTLSTEVCIDTDIYSTKKAKKACTVKTVSTGSQGAPVSITKIEPIMLENTDSGAVRPQFTLYISNSGNGRVFDIKNYQDACSSNPVTDEEVNRVQIIAKLSDKALSCNPSTIKLTKNDAVTRCTLESGITGANTFVASLVVQLDYGYSSTISKTFMINRIPH